MLDKLTNAQIAATAGRLGGFSEVKPLGQQWENVYALVRKVIAERSYHLQKDVNAVPINAWQIFSMAGEPLFIHQDEASAARYRSEGHRVEQLYLLSTFAPPAQGMPVVCQGTNCGAADGQDHSPECIVETAEAQGWGDAPEVVAARQLLNAAPTPPEQEKQS